METFFTGNNIADLGFRVDEGFNILFYRKSSKYNLWRRGSSKI